jgi:hypothetical protein
MTWMQEHGYRRLVSYQPGRRFWAFQRIESGIFVLLTAGLVALACRRVPGRHA